MTTTLSTPATALPATAAHDLTGKRRIAFASYVDENYLPGFLVLLRSLALSNPSVCEDFVVLYDDLRPGSIAKIHALHRDARVRRHDPYGVDADAPGPQGVLLPTSAPVGRVGARQDLGAVLTERAMTSWTTTRRPSPMCTNASSPCGRSPRPTRRTCGRSSAREQRRAPPDRGAHGVAGRQRPTAFFTSLPSFEPPPCRSRSCSYAVRNCVKWSARVRLRYASPVSGLARAQARLWSPA
ncbi:hypothetical protein SFUMM280S_07751 [Streptomyces fumanus]